MSVAFPGANPAAPAPYMPQTPPPVFSPPGDPAAYGAPSPYGAAAYGAPSPLAGPSADQFAASQFGAPQAQPYADPNAFNPQAFNPQALGAPQPNFNFPGAPAGAPPSPVGAPVPPPAPGGALLPGFAPPPAQPDPATAAMFAPLGAPQPQPYAADPNGFNPQAFNPQQAFGPAYGVPSSVPGPGGLPQVGLPPSPMGVNYLA